jgi:hypothetical protein
LLASANVSRWRYSARWSRWTGLSAICRLDLYGAWRLLTVFETRDRCILLLVAEHTGTVNPYQLIYDALDISEPAEPRTKPTCRDAEGSPPVDADLAARLETGLADLARALQRGGANPRRR